MPIYFDVLMMISFLFSTYKLYLVLKEMLGFNQDERTVQEEGAEIGPISNIYQSFQSSKVIKGISYSIDFIIIVGVILKLISVIQLYNMAYFD